jgi:predicted TIM-barrel fold metal-dependent hydrolase
MEDGRVAKQDHFVALSECHFMNPVTMAEIAYYPNTQRWWASVDGVMRAWSGRDLSGEWPHPIAEELIKYMDEAGVDVCFCLREGMMDISGGTVSMSTNQFMLNQIEPYPERMYLECQVGPILRRGMENALWELEYLVRECNAKLCKVYQPEDLAPLDDKRMWPFYEKACELDISLTIHTGMSYVVPQPSFHTASSTSASRSTPACRTWFHSRASTPTPTLSTGCCSISPSCGSSPTTWAGPTPRS